VVGTLFALDTSDGFNLWSSESEGQVLSDPVVAGAVVYEALTNGPDRVRALHVDNGREIWAYSPEAG
jgi:outer membrane protein assembly factor BamB